MTTPHRSEAAYAGLLAALLDARHDAAGARFDAVLAAAEAKGDIGAELARELRYWQRAASHAMAEHVRFTVPRTLGVLEEAATQAVADVDDLADAWRRASDPQRGDTARSATTPTPRAGSATPPPERHSEPTLLDVRRPHEPAGRAAQTAPGSGAGEAAPTDLLEHRRRALVAGLLNANPPD